MNGGSRGALDACLPPSTIRILCGVCASLESMAFSSVGACFVLADLVLEKNRAMYPERRLSLAKHACSLNVDSKQKQIHKVAIRDVRVATQRAMWVYRYNIFTREVHTQLWIMGLRAGLYFTYHVSSVLVEGAGPDIHLRSHCSIKSTALLSWMSRPRT
jgi:hypothetical protein